MGKLLNEKKLLPSEKILVFNPITLRMAKTQSFGHSERNGIKSLPILEELCIQENIWKSYYKILAFSIWVINSYFG